MNTLTSKEQSHHKMHYVSVQYDRTCKCCGNDFVAHNSRKVYCSKHCSTTASHIRRGHKINTNPDPYKRQCVVCGKDFETYKERKKCCSPECSSEWDKKHPRLRTKKYIDKRYKYTWEEYVLKRKSDAFERQKVKQIEKEFYIKAHTVERECVICGSLFYCLDKESRKTCSSECSKKYANRAKDRRLNKNNIVDYDINLEKLYERDGGVCYICGRSCNWNDYKTVDGAFIAKDNYPSIEHVIPLSLGGKHQWENVRLAHMKCNWEKGNTTPDYTEEMSREHARKLAINRAQCKKKTAQYSIDGKLIRIWDSTAQIRRELGLSDKHIQNVCRGNNSNTGNAYGYHWQYVVEHEDLKLKGV